MKNIKFDLFPNWLKIIREEYKEYIKKSGNHRCKIIGIETDKETGRKLLSIVTYNVKSYLPLQYFPEELVINDSMLSEFSQTDVRAITFYALHNTMSHSKNLEDFRYSISGQEFQGNKTIFLIYDNEKNTTLKISALEIYKDFENLKKFNFNDLLNIIHSAVQEQTVVDLE